MYFVPYTIVNLTSPYRGPEKFLVNSTSVATRSSDKWKQRQPFERSHVSEHSSFVEDLIELDTSPTPASGGDRQRKGRQLCRALMVRILSLPLNQKRNGNDRPAQRKRRQFSVTSLTTEARKYPLNTKSRQTLLCGRLHTVSV